MKICVEYKRTNLVSSTTVSLQASFFPVMSTSSQSSGQWLPPSLEEMGEMLPQYQFESLLGRGGMGAVFKAVQTSLDRAVAIKILPADLIGDTDLNFLERFKNEARTMAKLNHPGIVNVYDFGEARGGLLYFVMEFVNGTDVARMISSQGRLPEDYALSITAHVCDALAYAHKHGVVHRDIKPANILINMEGAVKVADFGLAKMDDPGQSGLTKTNMAMGTPDFVAPEALIPGVPLDGRADLYAIGVMLYQMLTGEIPRGIWTLPGKKHGTDPRFDSIITKAMQTDREARYQTAGDIRKDIDSILTVPRATLVAQKQAAAEAAAKAVQAQAAGKVAAGSSNQRHAASAQAAARSEGKKSGKGMIVSVVAAAVAVVAGAFVLTGDKKPPTQPPAETAADALTPPAQSAPATAMEQAAPRAKPTVAQAGEIMLFQGHRYQFLPGPFRLDAAGKKADELGGHLVTINSAEEQTWIEATFAALIATKHEGWCRTAGDWASKGKSWRWLTGEPFMYVQWAPNYPNDRQGEGVLYLHGKDGGLLWKNSYWSRPCSALIEWDDAEEKPAVASAKSMPPSAPEPKPDTSPGAEVKPGQTLTFGGHRYQFLAGPFVRDEASDKARALGGHLLTINSAEEQQWIEKSFAAVIPSGWCRIGGERDPDTKPWRWTTKEPFDYTQWAPGSPDESPARRGLFLCRTDGKLPWKNSYWSHSASTVVEWDDDGEKPPPQATSSELKPVPVEAGWTDLITGADVQRDSLMEPWTLENGVLLSPKEPKGRDSPDGHTVLRLPIRDASKNYDLRFRILRVKDGHSVVIAFARGDESPRLGIDGGYGIGIPPEKFNKKDDGGKWLPQGESHDIQIEVREGHVRIFHDGIVRFEHDGTLPGGQSDGYFFLKSKMTPPIFAIGVCNGRIAVLQAAYKAVEVSPMKMATTVPPATSDPVIARLDASFHARLAADVTKAFDAGVARLNTSYVGTGIANARAAAQARGSLKDLTALDAEKKRIAAGQGVPEQDDEGTPAVLTKLRTTYRAAMAKLRGESDAKALPLYKTYLTAIEARIAELTRAGEIQMAKALQNFHDELAKAASAERGANELATAPVVPAKTSPMPETKVAAPSHGGSSWRMAAEFLVRNGGSFVALRNGAPLSVTKEDEIPSGRFEVQEITIDHFNSVLPQLKDADLGALGGLRDLRRVWIRPSAGGLSDAAFAFLANNVNLERVILEGAQDITDGIISHLLPLKKLSQITIAHAPRFTGAGFEQIAGAGNITEIDLYNCGVTDAGMQSLAKCKKLQSLRLNSKAITSAGFAALAECKAATALDLADTAFDDEACGVIATLPKLASLLLSNTKLTDSGLNKLQSLKKLTALDVRGSQVSAEAAAAFQRVMPQCRVSR